MSALYLMAFADWRVGPFQLPDIGIAILILYFIKNLGLGVLTKWNREPFFLLFIITLTSLANCTISDLTSVVLFKFIMLMIFINTAVSYFSNIQETLAVACKRLIYIISILSVVSLILYMAGFNFYNLSFFSIPKPMSIVEYGTNRFCGIFTEPAHLSISLNCLLSYLLLSEKREITPLVFVGVLSVASMSMIGVLWFLFNIFLYFKSDWNAKRIAFLMIVVVVSIFVAIKVPYIQNRLLSSLKGTDQSALIRLLGGWQIAVKAPIYGVGLFRIDDFIKYTLENFSIRHSYGNMFINNIPAAVYAIGGVAGLIGFVVYILKMSCKKLWPLMTFVLICMASGNFNTSITWFQFALIGSVAINIVNERKRFEQ